MSDRYQYVKINNSTSNKIPVTSGVPQGSVLGPTLFIYFINDLPSVTEALMKIFADDTKAHNEVIKDEDRKFLQNAIDDMYLWTLEWLLGFNEDKCNILHLGKNNPQFNYDIGPPNSKVNLGTSTSEKDLGVYVDPLLNFENHVNQTTKKASRVSFQIIKNICFKTKNIMVPLFKSLVRPILEYANSVWANNSRKNIDSIEHVQRFFT